MLTRDARAGFTMVEVIVALVILAVAVLGLSASAATLATRAADAELRAEALYAVQDRLSEIQMDSRYGSLDTLYEGTDSSALGRAGFTMTTSVTHVEQTNPSPMDYKVVAVVVDGPVLGGAISRQIVVAAP
ncbi:MAG: type II secretion system protein [Gemmatimonadota bacterium]|jgi:prepilin-type N-terminal cleavage/methylation domain-containing protein